MVSCFFIAVKSLKVLSDFYSDNFSSVLICETPAETTSKCLQPFLCECAFCIQEPKCEAAMLIRKSAFCILLLLLITSIGKGQTTTENREKVIAVPRTSVLPIMVYQPDCPLRLEGFSFISSIKGGTGAETFRFRNIGTKPIQSYTIATLNISGTPSELNFVAKTPAERIHPGETFPNIKGNAELIPLTEEIRKKLNLDGPMLGVVCLMVVRVELDDGTVYSDESAYKALQAYLQNLSTKISLKGEVLPGGGQPRADSLFLQDGTEEGAGPQAPQERTCDET